MKFAIVISILFLFFSFSFAGSNLGHGHFLNKIKSTNKSFDLKKSGIEVSDLNEEKVLVKEKGHSSFYTLARKNKIKQFSCNECHASRKVKNFDPSAKLSHAQVKLQHGDSKTMNCTTCHSTENRNLLKSITKKNIDFDRSYNLCAQCHFKEKRDWLGGAHGKRLKFWAGDRLVKNCTSCHDPHKPNTPTRWPKTYSRPIRN